MKKSIYLIVFLTMLSYAFAANHNVVFPNSANEVCVSQVKSEGLRLDWSVNNMNIFDKEDDNGKFTHIVADGFIGTGVEGLPSLPYMGRFITVPVNAEVNVNFINTHTSEISLDDIGFDSVIYPAQPSYSKSTDLSSVQFVYNKEVYKQSDYDKNYGPFNIKEVGFLRGYRVFEVNYTPVKYNPVENTLTVYDAISVEITFDNANYSLTEYNKARTWSADFESVYQKYLLNYEAPVNREELERHPTKYLIISHSEFVTAMQPFVDWKVESGFDVILASTADPAVGNTTGSIKSYIESLWNAATPEDPAPSYILFVGDVAQIPAWNASASPSGHITDLTYVKLEGNDFLPEMYYGRFSANNLNELTPQIEKTLLYEKYEMEDPSYLEKAVLIAGVDASWSTSHANGQINYSSSLYFTPENGYPNPDIYLYPASGSNASNIISDVSQGTGWVNYTAHGGVTDWSNPNFTINNVNSLQNEGMYPVVIGNCCLTNKFEQNCFGEAWLRAANKGSVIYIGGTNSTYWDEDYWWSVGYVSPPSNGVAVPYNAGQLGMYDMLFHTHNEAYEDWHITTGAMIYAGNMVVQSTSSSKKNYYWEIYSIMGDPSLVPYLAVPAENNAQYPSEILLGQSEINITNAAPYSRVALSIDGVIHGTVFTDESGSATLEFMPFTEPGNARLVISAQKHIPVIQDIQVIPSDGPYITFENVINNLSGDSNVDFATTSNLSIIVNNVGSFALENATVTLTSNSNLVDVIEGTFTIDEISPESVYQIPDTFIIEVSSELTNLQALPLTLTVYTSPTQSWVMPIELIVNASNLEVVDYVINDETGNNNGRLDPGEDAEITVNFLNNGNAPSLPANVLLASTNPLVVLENQNAELQSIHHQQTGDLVFNVSVDEEAPLGALTSLSYFVNLSNQDIQMNYTLPIGLVVEDFESGDFEALPWQNSSIVPWTIEEEIVFNGDYSAKSGAISHNQTSTLQIPYVLESEGVITFSVKTSTEATYDKLQFYVNSSVQEEWSGENDWATFEYTIPAGTYTFKWVYRKDANNSEGQDAVWIDDIIFPSSGGGNVSSPIAGTSVDEIIMGQTGVNEVVSANFNLINLGNQSLSGSISTPEGFYLSSTNSFNILPFNNQEITISFISEEVGTFGGDIVITTNDTTNPELTIPVTVEVTNTGDNNNSVLPIVTQLNRNYPNPFNPETTISFDLKDNSYVNINIYNVKGQKVKTLVNENLNRGQHSVLWNGKDENQKNVSSGVYFYRMTTKDYSSTSKMLLIK
jgi:hypothetical protein